MKSILKKIIISLITFEAKLIIKKYKPKIVGVTGSVGKTSAKDAIFTALAKELYVRKSEKSFNSELGIPLTILGCPNGWNNPFIWASTLMRGFAMILLPVDYPEWLVVEVGADRPNDIKNVTKWMKPDIAVITRLGDVPVHVEFFKNKAEIVEEKSYLVRAVKNGGTVIVNGDDEDALSFLKFTKNKSLVISMEREGDVSASNASITYRKQENGNDVPVGMNFKVNFSGNCVPINLTGVVGVQHVYPSLFAVAVGIAANLNVISLCEALSREVETPGRMHLVPGIKNSLIIDDSYNSSPVALQEALRTLFEIKVKKRKIAILGDMMELGSYSREEHLYAGKIVSGVAHILVTIGIRSKDIAEGALQNGMSEKNIFQFDNAQESLKFLDGFIGEGDIILVKGSQSVRMEKIVEEIMANPEDKEKLLARQDKEWQKR